MVILRGWAEAPLSPRLQGQSPGARGRPTGRATTLKAKSPRALPQRADLTSPTGAREFRSHQTAQTLLSAQAVGPQAGCSPHPHWDTPLPDQPSSRLRVWSAPRRDEEQTWIPHNRNWRLGLEKRAHAHPGPTTMTAIRRECRVRKPAMSTQWWQGGPEPRKIDVSVGKIYILLPRQKGQVLQPHSRLWRKLQLLAVPQLQLLLPERYGADLPYQARGHHAGNPSLAPIPRVWALWLELFSNTGKGRVGQGRGPGEGHTARAGCSQSQQSSLALSLVRARAFPPIRLPLLMEPANADPLAPPH